MLKTVVYQSYRTTDVPGWIHRCMQTVKDWAALKRFDYAFVDDRLFEYAPPWYRERVNNQVQLVTDLARLELAREFLSGEFERAIWVDADIVVFDTPRFEIEVNEEYAFCQEVWVEKNNLSKAVRRGLSNLRRPLTDCRRRVNNSVAVFIRGNSFLDFYIHACQLLIKNKRGGISNLEVGTFFLTELNRTLPLPLLKNVGLFSPVVMRDIAAGGGIYARTYIKEFGSPVRAANLCASYSGKAYDGVMMDNRVYNLVLDKLIETEGEVINGILRRAL